MGTQNCQTTMKVLWLFALVLATAMAMPGDKGKFIFPETKAGSSVNLRVRINGMNFSEDRLFGINTYQKQICNILCTNAPCDSDCEIETGPWTKKTFNCFDIAPCHGCLAPGCQEQHHTLGFWEQYNAKHPSG